MFNSFYGLSYNPFDKQQIHEKDHFVSNDFTEMIHRLNYLKEIRGIGVFTARPGMGKSYALRCFASSLNPSLYHMEYMCLSTISVADFYKQLCSILGVSEKGGKPAMFAAIREQITYLYKEKRQPLLLAIDEAQYLNTGILNDIKMLMNYGYDSVNYFTMILCGESHLNDTLRKPVPEALRQRPRHLSQSLFPPFGAALFCAVRTTQEQFSYLALSALLRDFEHGSLRFAVAYLVVHDHLDRLFKRYFFGR